MNKTLCALSIAMVSLSALHADEIEKAIKKGKPDVIKALTNAGISYSEEAVQEYIQLAEEQLAQKKAAQTDLITGSISGIDLVGHAIESIVFVGSLMGLYKHLYHDESKWQKHKEHYALNWAFFVVSAGKSVQGGIKMLKELTKKDKVNEAVEHAEKVLEAVKELRISVPQIAA